MVQSRLYLLRYEVLPRTLMNIPVSGQGRCVPPPFPFPQNPGPCLRRAASLPSTRQPHQSPEQHAARTVTRKLLFRVALSSRLRSRQRRRLAIARHRCRGWECRSCIYLASDFHLGNATALRPYRLTLPAPALLIRAPSRRPIDHLQRAWSGPGPACMGPARKAGLSFSGQASRAADQGLGAMGPAAERTGAGSGEW
jgi:hypothetical protein